MDEESKLAQVLETLVFTSSIQTVPRNILDGYDLPDWTTIYAETKTLALTQLDLEDLEEEKIKVVIPDALLEYSQDDLYCLVVLHLKTRRCGAFFFFLSFLFTVCSRLSIMNNKAWLFKLLNDQPSLSVLRNIYLVMENNHVSPKDETEELRNWYPNYLCHTLYRKLNNYILRPLPPAAPVRVVPASRARNAQRLAAPLGPARVRKPMVVAALQPPGELVSLDRVRNYLSEHYTLEMQRITPLEFNKQSLKHLRNLVHEDKAWRFGNSFCLKAANSLI